MTAKLSAERIAELAADNALGRINSIDEVARFIVFLAGTENISGQIFQLDSRISPWA
jgi:NAD(P)-dependent dehydrogenase (short-subunit alcohol dehydrogenase family)